MCEAMSPMAWRPCCARAYAHHFCCPLPHPRDRLGVIELHLSCRATNMIEPPSSDDEGPAVDLDLPETLEALAEWCDTRMTKWANCAIKNKGAKQDIAADAAIMRAKMFKEKATSLRLKENLARIGNSSKLCSRLPALVMKLCRWIRCRIPCHADMSSRSLVILIICSLHPP